MRKWGERIPECCFLFNLFKYISESGKIKFLKFGELELGSFDKLDELSSARHKQVGLGSTLMVEFYCRMVL